MPAAEPAPPARRPARSRRARHRDHRGVLAWPAVPAMATRRDLFDSLVLDALERVESRAGQSLEAMEIAVEDVPPGEPTSWEEAIPLARLFPRSGGHPARVVLYRRPITARCTGATELSLLVEHVVVHQVANLLGVPPEDLEGEA